MKKYIRTERASFLNMCFLFRLQYSMPDKSTGSHRLWGNLQSICKDDIYCITIGMEKCI